MSCAVECQQVVVAFGARRVLDALDWRLDPGEIVGLVGYSGAGKTTLLRVVAGLARCDGGRVLWDGSAAAPRAGRVGMVFQNLALWPHLTARRQVECVLPAGRSARARAEALLSEVRLPPPAWDLAPAQLSGGEAQRLALARALGSEPELLLLDEPLAHLDEALRGQMRELLADLLRARSVTAIYVTHAWQEAAELCPRIAVLLTGRIRQEGSAADLYWRPASVEVARLTGPLVEAPVDWERLAIVRAGDAAEVNGVLGVCPREGETCLVRPQQLRLSITDDAEAWRVVACLPQAGAWVATLARGARRWQSPCAAPLPVGAGVGVEILPVVACRPPAAEVGELKSPSKCGTRNSS